MGGVRSRRLDHTGLGLRRGRGWMGILLLVSNGVLRHFTLGYFYRKAVELSTFVSPGGFLILLVSMIMLQRWKQ